MFVKSRKLLIAVPAFLVVAGTFALVRVNTEKETSENENPDVVEEQVKVPVRVALPEEIRGLYWTANTASLPVRRGQLLEFMKDAGFNSVVIDVKFDNGELGFTPIDPALAMHASDSQGIKDLDALLEQLGNEGVYRIARVAVFRDSYFAQANPSIAIARAGGGLWRDKTGAAWIDPSAREAWEYNARIAREMSKRGFDEIQFDYVRFPSDGVLSTIRYTVYDSAVSKTDALLEFFKFINGLRSEGIRVSADVFGIIMNSDQGRPIGQLLANVYPYVDFISPMVYPSHYPDGFNGYANPALFPYEIVKQALDDGALMLETELGIAQTESRKHFRPWLQDFDIGAVYTRDRIQAQIKASRDGGASGYMMWNARNVYEQGGY